MNNPQQKRLARERRTIQTMIHIYCHGSHHPANGELCADCQELRSFAMQRIDKCPFQAKKPTCAKCPIHCYKPAMREKVRRMMRYSGPRMLVLHPLLTVQHYMDEISQARIRKTSSKPTDEKSE